MNKIKFIIIIILFLGMFLSEGYSQIRQGTYLASFEYSTAFNVGRASDFLSAPGWTGGTLILKSFIKKNTAVGFTVGWNVLAKEEENGSVELQNGTTAGTVSGPMAKYFNYMPLYGNVSYYFNKNRRSSVIPYVQANIGTMYIWQRAQLGIYQKDNDNWHFALGPEAGVMFKFGDNFGITVDGRYNYAFSSGSTLVGKDGNDFSFFNANIGVTYIK